MTAIPRPRSTKHAKMPPHRAPSSRTRRVKAPDPDLSNSEIDLEEDTVHVEETRKARAEFYSRPVEERQRDSGAMSRQRTQKAKVEGSKRSALRSSAPLHGARSHSSHHRRRRRKSPSDDDDAQEYVYRTVERTDELPPRRARAGRSSTSLSHYGHSSASGKLQVLRTLGLQPPERSRSVRDVTRSTTSSNRSAPHKDGSRLRRKAPAIGEIKKETASSIGSQWSRPRRYAFPIEGNVTKLLRLSRSVSLKEKPTPSSSRPSLARSQTTTRKVRHHSHGMNSIAEETSEKRGGSSPKLQRSASVFGTLFGPPRPPGPESK